MHVAYCTMRRKSIIYYGRQKKLVPLLTVWVLFFVSRWSMLKIRSTYIVIIVTITATNQAFLFFHFRNNWFFFLISTKNGSIWAAVAITNAACEQKQILNWILDIFFCLSSLYVERIKWNQCQILRVISQNI